MRTDREPGRLPDEAEQGPGSVGATAARLAVLVVDDEALVRDVVQAALEDGGYAVVAAENGRAAVSILEERSADYRLLVTDIALGAGPSGWDVARRGREIYPDLAVLYMSGANLYDYASQGVPNSTVVSKPFDLAEILADVSALMRI